MTVNKASDWLIHNLGTVRWEMRIHEFVVWLLIELVVDFVVHDCVMVEWYGEVEVVDQIVVWREGGVIINSKKCSY